MSNRDGQAAKAVDGENGPVILIHDDFALESPIGLASLRESILSELESQHGRVCHECGKPMVSGYCINGGCKYYCSEECLHKHYTPDEWEKMYDNGNGNSDSYYTDWED